ncbi:MAG: VOC family protein [Armatimonadetes bacterium]|nr:VOC family protein [Armatimonadota bacterium]
MLLNCFHFSFTVSDIEASVHFYRDILGMKLVHRMVHDQPYTSKQVAFDNAFLKVALFTIDAMPQPPSGHILELIEYANPRGEPTDTATNRPGAAHMAFQVDDLQAEYARMKALGVRFKSEPVQITAGRNAGGWTVYLLDPDNITLEMVQPKSL